MQLAKVSSTMLAALSIAVLTSFVCGSTSMAAETSESKEEDLESSITAIAEEPKEMKFPKQTGPVLEFELNVTPLNTFDNIEETLVQSSMTTTESDEEIMDEAEEDTQDDEDIDPLSYYAGLPEPDWSVIPLDQSLVETVFYEAAENKVDPCVVIALMQSESGFKLDVVSSAGCYGLMQLHPLYYPEDIVDPYRNIHYGVETIGNNLQKTDGNYVEALSIYANGHVGTNFTYQYDVMRRAEEWRTTLQEANII